MLTNHLRPLGGQDDSSSVNEPMATCPLSALLATPTGLLAGWLVVQHCQLTKFPPMMQVSLSLSFARSGEGPPIYLDYVLLFQTCISLPVDLDLVCIYACYVPLTCTRATVVSQKTNKTRKKPPQPENLYLPHGTGFLGVSEVRSITCRQRTS